MTDNSVLVMCEDMHGARLFNKNIKIVDFRFCTSDLNEYQKLLSKYRVNLISRVAVDSGFKKYDINLMHHILIDYHGADKLITDTSNIYFTANYGFCAVDRYFNRHLFGISDVEEELMSNIESLFNREIDKYLTETAPKEYSDAIKHVSVRYIFKYSETISRSEYNDRLCNMVI